MNLNFDDEAAVRKAGGPAREAEAMALEAVLACYARDVSAAAFRDHAPRHDSALAGFFPKYRGALLRLPFPTSGVDVYCGVDPRAASGRHRVHAPFVLRARCGGEARVLRHATDALSLVARELDAAAPGTITTASCARARSRLVEAIEVSASVLEHRRRLGPTLRSLDDLTFLAAEQSLLAGHAGHPLAKARTGFSPDDVRRYSPEMGEPIRLSYLLAHPDIVVADCVRGRGFDLLRDDVLASADTPPHVRAAIGRRPSWLLLPLHPWELRYLSTSGPLEAARAAGVVEVLGEAGGPFYATASVRTLHRPGFPVDIKVSLHVALTNSLRVNHLHELRRGCAVARLLDSTWGERLERAAPALRFQRDEAFAALAWNGAVIEGTAVALREHALSPTARVALVAAFQEPPLVGAALASITVAHVAARHDLSRRSASALWLTRYFDLLLGSALAAYEACGLALEIHAQNLLVELDDAGLPTRLHFRDNQGYYFREGVAAELAMLAPELARESPCVVAEAALHGPLAYYLLVNNAIGVIDAFAAQDLLPASDALPLLRGALLRHRGDDTTGFVDGVLNARTWPVKGNLRMALEDRDEAQRPLEAPATYVEIANPIPPPGHPCAAMVRPRLGETIHRHVWSDGAIELRAFDLQRDLETVHDWVNLPYSQRFWDNAGPLASVEAWYAELLASGHGSAFVGTWNGAPSFVIETYWAPRDVVGTVYDAKPGDYGFHLLACPPEMRPRGLARRAFQASLEMAFGLPEVERIVGEANRLNPAVDACIRSVGYVLDRVVKLPDKEANLTFCTRESLVACCPDAASYLTRPRALSMGATFREVRP